MEDFTSLGVCRRPLSETVSKDGKVGLPAWMDGSGAPTVLRRPIYARTSANSAFSTSGCRHGADAFCAFGAADDFDERKGTRVGGIGSNVY